MLKPRWQELVTKFDFLTVYFRPFSFLLEGNSYVMKISTPNAFDKQQSSLKFCSKIVIKAWSKENMIISFSLQTVWRNSFQSRWCLSCVFPLYLKSLPFLEKINKFPIQLKNIIFLSYLKKLYNFCKRKSPYSTCLKRNWSWEGKWSPVSKNRKLKSL